YPIPGSLGHNPNPVPVGSPSSPNLEGYSETNYPNGLLQQRQQQQRYSNNTPSSGNRSELHSVPEQQQGLQGGGAVYHNDFGEASQGTPGQQRYFEAPINSLQ